MAEVYPSDDEVLNIEDTKELTLEDLRKTTWNYGENDLVGIYNNTPIMIYLFEVVNCSVDRNLLTVQSCNVEEGWIDFIEVSGEPVMIGKKMVLPGQPKIVDDCIVRTKINCLMIVNILDTKDNIIATLSN